jgi:hypothetical protein
MTPSEPFCATKPPLVGKYSVASVRPPLNGPQIPGYCLRDLQRRQLPAVVVGGDLRVVPVGDLAREYLRDGLAGQAQVAHELSGHPHLVRERRATGDDRQVRVRAAQRAVPVTGARVDPVAVRDVGDRVVDRLQREVLAALR